MLSDDFSVEATDTFYDGNVTLSDYLQMYCITFLTMSAHDSFFVSKYLGFEQIFDLGLNLCEQI